MSKITVLDENTINQIAAGEVIERPAAVVKELVENAIDAGANAVTVEIKEGGISLIRITDNGSGIEEEDMPLVFLRHSTSKIRTAEDLLKVTSLGFRGEALSSIAAIAQVELVTKTSESFSGLRYIVAGGEEKSLEHIGCPNGTTFIIRNLFYNTPARKKFLKSSMTEAGYISDLMERLAVSHPGVSFKFINNGQVKLHTSGNNNLKDIIYNVYGRDITSNLVSLEGGSEEISLEGFIAKPVVSRGNRNYENYFINGRYIKSNLINKAIEEAFRPYIMLHRYPFTSLHIRIASELIDVNVHPAKLEIRFKNGEDVYQLIYRTIKNALEGKEMIPDVFLTEEKQEVKTFKQVPEPFEEKRRQEFYQENSNFSDKVTNPDGNAANNRNAYNSTNVTNNTNTIGNTNITDATNTANSAKVTEITNAANSNSINNNTAHSSNTYNNASKYNNSTPHNTIREAADYSENRELIKDTEIGRLKEVITDAAAFVREELVPSPGNTMEEAAVTYEVLAESNDYNKRIPDTAKPEQLSFISKEAIQSHRIIGQVFSTYWLVEFGDKLFYIDQHAAHEKVLYEKIMKSLKEKQYNSQMLEPPIILSLSMREEEAMKKHQRELNDIGFEIEEFGGKEYAVRAVPSDLFGLVQYEILIELIDGLMDEVYNETPEVVLEKIASMSCKAAVKGNHHLSNEEARALIEELLTLDNPYHCPHGRPTIISMSKYELEKKFKRIV
jgi:DNA mismatch repair protein MutL